MKKIAYILSLLALLIGSITLSAQESKQYAIYNYRNDGDFNAFLNIDVDSITYSCFDLDSVEHEDIVVQEVWTPDSVYRIPIEFIDSIGFRAPEPEFKVGVFIIDERHLPYIVDADDKTISFMQNTPSRMMPIRGQVVYSDLVVEPFYMGFAGRVIEIEREADIIKIICEPVSPDEVYDKCIELIKISTDEDDVVQVERSHPSPRKVIHRNIANDGTIKIPSLNFSVGYGGVSLDAKVSYTIEYAFCVGITDKDFVDLKVTRETEYSTNLDVKLDKADGFSQEEWLPWPIYTLGAGNKIGFSVNAGLFFDLKGSINLTAKLPYKSTHVDHYTWSSDVPFQYLENKNGGWPGWEEFLTSGEVKLKVKGSVAFGPILEASFQVWKPSFLSIDARAKGGLELSGEVSLDMNELNTDGFDAYKTVSEDMKITTGLKIGGEIGYTIKDDFEKIASADITFFKKERYLFPRFTQPTLPQYTGAGWEEGLSPLSLYSEPSNSILFPGKVGLAVFDNYGNRLSTTYSDTWFFGTGDWQKSWLQCSIANLEHNKQYVISPLFKMLNLCEVVGSPSSLLTIPQSISLETNTLSLQKGQTKSVLVKDGWGSYQITNGNTDVAYATFNPKDFASGGPGGGGGRTWSNEEEEGSPQIYIMGKGLGETVITIKDLRSNETVQLHVNVTEGVNPTDLSLSTNTASMNVRSSSTVQITSGSGSYTAVSDHPEIADASVNGSTIAIEAHAAGIATITVTDTQSGQTATIEVTVTADDTPTTDAVAVDLGLPSGTKWADRNVGASKPEDYGGYYAWGETEEKEGYSWSTYIHCDGSEETCHDIGSDIAGTQYDVAHVKWGGSWKMPTLDQVKELFDNCTSEWTTQNSVNGRKFTGPNGKSIFLPAAGYRWDGELRYAGSHGDYWSSTLNESKPYRARSLYFDSGDPRWNIGGNRFLGFTVRPVR